MDIVIFFIGLFCLLRHKDKWVLAIINLLATSFMQLRLGAEYRNFLFKHEYVDMGNLLFIIYVVSLAIRHGSKFKFRGYLQNAVSLFFLFLLISGIYDMLHGVLSGDVIRYWRHWLLLTLIYFYPAINKKVIFDSFKISFYICAILCGIILIQRFTPIEILHIIAIDEQRGVKAPSFAIIFGSLLLATNIFKQRLKSRVFYIIIFTLPIVLNLKMTYAVTVFLIFVVYMLTTKSMKASRKIAISIVTILATIAFFAVNSDFTDRFNSVTNERSAISQGENEGNFSFRILHAEERLNYILQDEVTAIRGIGFVSESHFNHYVFLIGLTTEDGDVIQLDTGDISWSVFFVRLGLVGLAVYLMMYLIVTFYYYRYRRVNPLNAYMFSMMLVFLAFCSLGNAIITESSFFIYPLLFLKDINVKANLN